MLANLRALFGVVVDIVLLRRGPEHLPASPPLLVVFILLYAGVTALVYTSVAPAHPRWLLALAFEILGALLWYRAALQMSSKPERFVQTMIALFAVRAIFAPLIMPLTFELMTQMQAQQSPSGLLQLLFLGLFVWWLTANAKIIKAAFEWPWPPAVIMVLGEEFALFLASAAIFGNSAPSN
jgi:hypothetical protein